MVQLRLKSADARTLVDVGRALVAALPVPVIVNDRADVALACGAAGVHLGADDVPLAALRRVLPPTFVIGASVRADTAGADYVGIGPVFASASKADAPEAIGINGFVALRARSPAPAVAIGGITAEHCAALRRAGAIGVAVIAAVFGTADPEASARQIREAWAR